MPQSWSSLLYRKASLAIADHAVIGWEVRVTGGFVEAGEHRLRLLLRTAPTDLTDP